MVKGKFKFAMILFWAVFLLVRVPPILGWVDSKHSTWVLGIPFGFAWFWGWSLIGLLVTLVFFYSFNASEYDSRIDEGVE